MRGTEPTPVQLTPHYSRPGEVNLEDMVANLRKRGVAEERILDFRNMVNDLRAKHVGQILPLTKAAESIGAEVHWVN